MTRVNLLLIAAVLATAFWLVHLQYQSRVLYSAIYQSEKEARQLEIERERLEAELRTQGTAGRVERIAREQMQMRPANAAITHYLVPGASSAAARPAEAQR